MSLHHLHDSQGPREAAVKDNLKVAEVSTPEKTCVHPAISLISKSGHEAVSLERETVPEEEDPAEAETRTHKRARVESCSRHEAHDEMEKTTGAGGEHSYRNHKSSTEPEHKKLPQPCSISDQLAKVKQSIVDTITTGRQFSSELETKEQSIVDTITTVRKFRAELETKEQSIVDTLASVRQFRSEIKKKEDNLEASLQEVDILGEKIVGINKILIS
ncbi:hypothetical protein AALP_AA7G173300 [Arabis alpina]|uniref:Uncharacterized protein n=1 Tax=Arabis alpina TaxID=50452 RepID=A0A087GIP2_ARAAL|nr:hypothetical protein AALP_AA7G173300 [Arabis alpina]